MPVSFEKLNIRQQYQRPHLADLWGYKGFQAISRGVVTPTGTNFIILFVTKQKQKALTQYEDYIDDNILHWEGEEKHASDARIISATRNNDEIHLFYRNLHHSPFVYYGEIYLKEYNLLSNNPSQFKFLIGGTTKSPDPIDDIEQYKNEYKNLEKTEQESIIKSRIGQGLFRDRLIKLWGGCSVTGIQNLSLLRASHIKPWRNCTNEERLDPLNGLLLHPTLDHLFDIGFITFEKDGHIRISEHLSKDDAEILLITNATRLRKIPDGLMNYMTYHRDEVFKKA